MSAHNRHDMQRTLCLLVLIGAWLGLLGCAATLPEQPPEDQPYALLVLPESIRLLAVDTQTFDTRFRISEMRLAPGAHSLRLAYVGDSRSHAGQQADAFRLETQAGQRYVVEART